MDSEAIDNLLQLGKEAARRGDDALALKYLHAVVEDDPQNETAWLWLSAVVESDDDQRLCLENVLVLNPENQAAQRGLRQLAMGGEAESEQSGQLITRQVAPVTPAAAILYPERQQQSWRWHDSAVLQQATIAGFSSESRFDDVWERESDLCAYCATELTPEESRCPGCRRRLVETTFRYPKASSDLAIYWVLILGIGQIALATIFLNLLSGGSPASLAWQSLILITMILLAIGLAFRRFWAYLASIVALLLMLAAMILGSSLGPVMDDSLYQLAGREFFLTIGEKPFAFLAGPAGDFIRILHYLAVPLALLYALFRVGPDFERIKERKVARLDRGISNASHFHGAGAGYARQGMWATAVLHFQRAAALEPANAFYQRELGEAYAQLGHYQRCLDVLESARQLTRDPEISSATERRMAQIRTRMPETGQMAEMPGRSAF